jgi:hypothetical protein
VHKLRISQQNYTTDKTELFRRENPLRKVSVLDKRPGHGRPKVFRQCRSTVGHPRQTVNRASLTDETLKRRLKHERAIRYVQDGYPEGADRRLRNA